MVDLTSTSRSNTELSFRTLFLALCVPLLVSLIYIVWLERTIDGGKRLLVLHLMVVSALLVGSVLALGILRRLPVIGKYLSTRFAVASVVALGGISFLLVYLGNAVSNLFWQDTLTFNLFRYFVLELHILRDDLPVSRLWICLILALVALLSTVFALLVSAPLVATLDRLFDWEAKSRIRGFGPFGPLCWVALAVTSFLAGAILLTVVWRPHFSSSSDSKEATQARFYARRLLGREPIIGLFVNDTWPSTFGDYWVSLQLGEAEAVIRASYPKDVVYRRKNVVLIISDALRPDHMQVYGYDRETTPFLSELHGTGDLRRVEMALATCPKSPCGISSILSSKSLASILPQNFALHELLYDQGYQVQFLLAGDHDWGGLWAFYGESITRLFDGPESKRFAASDDRVILEALESTEDFDGVPTFFYFHIMAPHVAAVRLPESSVFKPSDSRAWLMTIGQASNRQASVNFYDNGIVQADKMIQSIFETLDAKGYLRDALVIITSDHGESLGERREGVFARPLEASEGLYGHVSPELYQEYISIPLLIWEQGDTAYPNLHFARQIDIAPTVLDWLGLPIPSSWQGRSLLASSEVRQALVDANFRDASYALVVRKDRLMYKYIRYSSARWRPREELYELTSDPGELHDMINSAEQSLVEELRQRLADALSERQAM